MRKQSTVVDDYFQNVIKNSWTWNRLTEEEQCRFMEMDVFDKIKGNDSIRIEWLNTIYDAYLAALNYSPIGWRGTEEVAKF